MSAKSVVFTFGKLLIAGIVFVIGSMLGAMLAGALGIALPVMPAEIDPVVAGQFLPVVGALMAAVLAVFSKYSAVRFLPRWLTLSVFSWTVYALNNYLEARFFLPSMATSYVLVMNLGACFAVSAVVAWLFKPTQPLEPFWSKARSFCAARTTGPWTWRFLASLAAFPAAYFVFGWIVAPFVVDYYQQQYAGLALPTQGTMLVLALIRSLFFVLSILPLLMIWRGRRTGLFLTLGLALFLMVGGLNMMQAIWLPVILRIPHTLEILADSLVHAAALVLLLVPASAAKSRVGVIGKSVEVG